MTPTSLSSPNPSSTPAAATDPDEGIGSNADQLRHFLLGTKLNALLLFVPIAIALGVWRVNDAAIFITAFFALIPLARALGDLTEDIAKRTNAATAALINVTFGNATEVIVSIAALRIGQLDIIRYSLIGSIIGNMLLVTGSALVVAGMKYSMMEFNVHATNSFLTMLVLSSFCYVLPSTFSSISTGTQVDPSVTLSFSRQISAVMIPLYAAYLFFQHRTHAHLFDGVPVDGSAGDEGEPASTTAVNMELVAASPPAANDTAPSASASATHPPPAPPAAIIQVEPAAAAADEDDDAPEYTYFFAVVLTGVVAVLISVLSDYLVDSLNGAAESLKLSRHFIGLVIVAIVGNVAEHAGAIMMAYRNKMDIALSIAFGSSVQIGMFVMPLICLIGIFFDQPLDLAVTPFLIAGVFASVMLTLSIVNLGCATWLGGVQLLAAWGLFALAYINAPD